ncbi:MAG: hypothetical protein N4A48_08725 [Tepidibacter sp.]|uniref:hypothetical protein n=1 Tax=Tepidibacter sp. TaxID=2529387 RepID=UPI0025D76208|nr:hypothetical protein [Tepidibacter sp.]MCT4508830.1 hypothetical protein [Tepidibacter sp.]
MKNWRLFEDSCVEYLNRTYGNYTTKFVGTGKSNSTNSDIRVIKDDETLFNIEAKMANSQSGQFVLIDDGNKFIFSDRNKSQANKFTKIILHYINTYYNTFKSVSSKSIPIDLDTSIFAEWIKDYYKSKDVSFIITSHSDEDFIVFPIEKLEIYFDILANFRIKTSGSSDVPYKYHSEVKELFEQNFSECSIVSEEKKSYLTTNYHLPNKTKLIGKKYRFQFNKDGNRYLIRKLSNTRNANVIFSISLKLNQNSDDILLFKKEIE